MKKKTRKTDKDLRLLKEQVRARELAQESRGATPKAMEIGSRPPYMYTSACPSPEYRR